MTANRQDEARADIHARGFWGRRQGAFFDVRVFFTQMHLAIVVPLSNLFIGVMSRKRRGSMEIAFGRLSRPLLLL